MAIAGMPRSSEVDSLIRSLVPKEPGTALIAVGGYGREELFPHSDIDLLLVGPLRSAMQFAGFFQQLWDRGFRVSHSTHTPAECLLLHAENLELTLSLLDRRFLAGDKKIWDELDNGFRRLLKRKQRTLKNGTAKLTRERHERYQNTIYHLEPNVKDGPGGLRDIHVLRWFGHAGGLEDAEAALSRLRWSLHEYFQRDCNVLTFEAQDALNSTPDLLMGEYFRAARKVQHAMQGWLSPEQNNISQPPCRWPEFRDLLDAPDAVQTLRAMHDSEALGEMFDSWRRIEGLALRDYYHQYTVDEHSLVAIENVLRLRSEPNGPFASLARDTGHYPLLITALLLHDTGKGQGAQSHAQASAAAAAPDLVAIGMPEEERELVLFLIASHLEMSRIMTTRDLTDPQTARFVAGLTGSGERLALLTLMTYADISAVNPRALTPWRTTLLWQLYAATAELPFQVSPSQYKPGVTLERGEGVWTLAVMAPDRPFLLASVAGAVSSFGMDILRAEAYGTDNHMACERFTFTDPFETLKLNPEERQSMVKLIERAVAGLEDIPKLLSRRMTPQIRAGAMDIEFDHEASNLASVLTVTTIDSPGLLYRLAQSISLEGCNIETVLINTEGRKAIDVFYVTASGLKLTEEKEEQLSARIRSEG